MGERASPAGSTLIEAWLETLVARSGSDLFLVDGAPPSGRIGGQVEALGETALTGPGIEAAISPYLPARALEQFRSRGYADASFRHETLGRFRLNFHRERGRAAVSIRRLPSRPPRLAELGLPPGVEALSRVPHGLILIGGPAGSGKTTTVAALVNEINLRDRRHIVTIEDPIEYEHQHETGLVEQIEVGVDAPSFPEALRSVVRQSPDVIVVGEMRDPETMNIALAAGETGHLVLSTIHTSDIVSTISRVADSFPPERQATIRQELALALTAVMTQRLLPARDQTRTGGLAAAAELLVLGYGARHHIRHDRLQQLPNEIGFTRQAGSFSMETSLAELVRSGRIDPEVARRYATHTDELEAMI
jgi:twitching motility protein PilT